MEPIKLSDVASALSYEIDFDKIIKKVTTDSREVDEHSVFIAIVGDNMDGHDFIKMAFDNGAVACICSKRVAFLRDTDLCFYVKDTKQAYIDIAAMYIEKFENLKVVGITGSVGKTTIKDMIATCISESKKTMKTFGNLNNEVGLPQTVLSITKDDEVAVIEMGMDHSGDIDTLSRAVKPDVSIVTNIGVAHLEYMKTKENILRGKLEILNGMDKSAPIVLNFNDKLLYGSKKAIKNPIISYGVEDFSYGIDDISYKADNINVDFYGHNIEENYLENKTFFEILYRNREYKCILNAVGKHNVLNAVGAVAVCKALGLDIEKSVNGLRKYVPSGMRQNIVKHEGIIFIEDSYNANPDSMQAALTTLGNYETKGKKIAVLGDMYELGDIRKKSHENLADIAEDNAVTVLVCIGKFVKDTQKRALDIKNQRQLKTNIEEIYYFEEKEEAIKKLKKIIKKDDVVLFKASRGMGFEEIIEKLYKLI